MAQSVIGKTASRQVLGSINDFARMLDELEQLISRHRAAARRASRGGGTE